MIEFGLLMASASCAQGREALHFILDENLRAELNQVLMRESLQLDLSFFEDPEFYHILQRPAGSRTGA